LDKISSFRDGVISLTDARDIPVLIIVVKRVYVPD
jgi:hypothetical protein